MTSGNHIWDKRDIFNYIENAEKLLRPINYPKGSAGTGSRIFEKMSRAYTLEDFEKIQIDQVNWQDLKSYVSGEKQNERLEK